MIVILRETDREINKDEKPNARVKTKTSIRSVETFPKFPILIRPAIYMIKIIDGNCNIQNALYYFITMQSKKET